MAITTYTELQTAVGNWLDRSDLSSRIPEFIALAEARFNRVIRAPDMLSTSASFTVDSKTETLPTGFLEAKKLTLNTSPVVDLEYITPEQMSEWRELRTSSGKPRYFTVVGGNFEFLPTPGDSYTADVLYYKAIVGLATTSPNWLLTSHPDIYLFGALCEAEPFLKNDERVPLWETKLQTALAELEKLNQRKMVGTTPRARFRALD